MIEDLAERVHPRNTALLVVDMQNDYCHPEGALARDGCDMASSTELMLPRLLALIEASRQAGTKTIFICTNRDDWTDWHTRKALSPRWSQPLCRTGTWGAEFYGVSPQPDDYVITKHRYSAFIDTPLDLVLRSLGVQTLIVTGVATNVCVDCTARDGFQRDYFIVVPADCTATYSPEIQEATLANLDRHFGHVTTSREIMTRWTQVGKAARG